MPEKANMVALIKIDGYGFGPKRPDNAIAKAAMPTMAWLAAHARSYTVAGTGAAVGMREGKPMDANRAHKVLGAGRIFPEPIFQIDNALHDNTLMSNPAMVALVTNAKKYARPLHVFVPLATHAGLLDLARVQAILEAIAATKTPCMVHVLLSKDTIDAPSVTEVTRAWTQLFTQKQWLLASVVGGMFAYDNLGSWDETKFYFEALRKTKPGSDDPLRVLPHLTWDTLDTQLPVVHTDAVALADHDSLLFLDMREYQINNLVKTLTLPALPFFDRGAFTGQVVAATPVAYEPLLPVEILFPEPKDVPYLGQILSEQKIRQLRIGETVKFGLITTIMDGGSGRALPFEDFLILPTSPERDFAKDPEMNSSQVTHEVIQDMRGARHQFYVIDYPNMEIVGQTGDFTATVTACESVDRELKTVLDTVAGVGGYAIVLSSYGRAEAVDKPSPHGVGLPQSHTGNPTPCYVVGPGITPEQVEQPITVASIKDMVLTLFGVRA